MSVLNRIAYFQNRRDEVPNQELARELAAEKDKAGIREIAEHLWDKEQNIQSDCLKVLYETGYIDPTLIAEYVDDFLKLLHNRNNRMVWGSMIALSTIAFLQADKLYPHVEEIKTIMDKGTVITIDAGTKTLAGIASTKTSHRKTILPYLFSLLASCRPIDVPRHAEQILIAVDSKNRDAFIAILEKRTSDLKTSQLPRFKKVIQQAALITEN
jgi:hypothetical protein